ncbi:MAG: excisionase family DNA-binding protein [Dehalococcoidia bacterium]|nr:excisionase family DNA-binding protein [Dehalococcoidia bacterium]
MTTATAGGGPIVAGEDEIRGLRLAAAVLGIEQSRGEDLRAIPREAYLLGSSGEKVAIPEPLYEVLLLAVRDLAEGRGISIIPSDTELTTQQAADLLNVSRPHVIKLLDSGELPLLRKVGTHRRLRLHDVLEYRERRSKRRRDALRDLAAEAREAGIY